MPLGTFNLASRYMGGGGAGAVVAVDKRYQASKAAWGNYTFPTDTGISGNSFVIGTNYTEYGKGWYFTLGYGNKVGNGQAGTIEFWIKPRTWTGTQYYMSFGNGTQSVSQYEDLSVRGSNSGSQVYASGTFKCDFFPNSSFSSGTTTWYHIAFTTDGAGNWKLWRDGVQRATFTTSSGTIFNGFAFGKSENTGQIEGAWIDEFRVSKVQRYTASFTPASTFTNDSNTLALFHCENSSETDDGTGADGWLTPPAKASAATWNQASGTWTIASGASALGGALNGSGTRSGYVSVNPTNSSWYFNTSNPWTVEMRIWYPGTFGAFENILGIGTSVQGGDVWIRPKDGPVRFTYQANGENNDPGGLRSFTSPSHLAIVSNGSNNVKYFLNGVLEAEGTFTGANTRTFNFGSQGTIANRIDEVRISNTALYSSNFTVPSFPYTNNSSTTTLAYFPFHSNTTDAS